MIEDVLRGAATQSSQELDTKVAEDVRSFLFGPPGAGGLDLASLNIQRGRDLGVASYNDLHEAVGLDRAETFDDITSDADLAATIEALYCDPDAVDAWVGGLAEDAVEGGMLGEMFSLLLTDQFVRLRDGDPFWSEGRAGLEEELRDQLWQTNLSDVILRNTDVDAIQMDVFLAMNRIVGSDSHQSMSGTSEADFIFGASGRDLIYGRARQDDLNGGYGHDTLLGGMSNDTLRGSYGNDELVGGDGNDLLNGQEGNDTLTGGTGIDCFIFNAKHVGTNVITDFEIGIDVLKLKNAGAHKLTTQQVDQDLVYSVGTDWSLTLEDYYA